MIDVCFNDKKRKRRIKKKSVTIIHSATTETVRLPDDNNGVSVFGDFLDLWFKGQTLLRLVTKRATLFPNLRLCTGHRSHGRSHQSSAQKESAR